MAYAPQSAALQTPLGTIRVDGDHDVVMAVHIACGPPAARLAQQPTGAVAEAIKQLAAYFAGQRAVFDLPLASAQTERGLVLRRAIAAIPYGATTTYGDLATSCGSSARAVGQACRKNPFPIVIPCHRVLSRSGPDHYSAGDGPQTKSWLIAFERGHALTL